MKNRLRKINHTPSSGKYYVNYNYENHGYFSDFRLNGSRYREGYYLNGLDVGIWKFYDNNSVIDSINTGINFSLHGIEIDFIIKKI